MCKICSFINYAETLLKYFVRTFESLYGKSLISHNIHNLLHICNDVRKYGQLDSFSAFRFENFLSSIKGQLRKSDKPLQQLWKRYVEIQLNSDTIFDIHKKPVFSKNHCNGPVIINLNIVEQYKIYNGPTYTLQCHKENDRYCILMHGSCIYIENIIKTIDNHAFLVGRLLQSLGSLYVLPCSSEHLNIRLASRKFFRLGYWSLSEIMCKAWAIPNGNVLVIVPILHSFNFD